MKLNTWQTTVLLGIASYLVCILAQSLPFGAPVSPWPADVYAKIEIVGFISGVMGVFLMVKQSAWNYPVGLIWAIAYAYYFASVAQHYGEATLMIINAGYLIDGWIKWAKKANRPELPITTLQRRHWLIIFATLAVTIPFLILLLHNARGKFIYFDATTTSLALAAQYLTNRKVFQSWFFWIAANLVIIPVFVFREYYSTAILYTIFTVMAVYGIKSWRESHTNTPNQKATAV